MMNQRFDVIGCFIIAREETSALSPKQFCETENPLKPHLLEMDPGNTSNSQPNVEDNSTASSLQYTIAAVEKVSTPELQGARQANQSDADIGTNSVEWQEVFNDLLK